MELSLDLTPEDGADGSYGSGLASPMGGKHQRDLSLSAKWANNKGLALEYLKRQREAILWIESVLDRKLGTRDLFEALKSGIVLREVLAKLYPAPSVECRSPISRNYSSRMAPWKERENISVFLKQCRAMGLNDLFLFCTDDLYEGTNMVQVLFGVQHFMAFSQEKSKYLFKPIEHETITFSNQEVEMALSKIEKAGVEADAFFTVAPPSPSPSSLQSGEGGEDVSPPDTAAPTLEKSEEEPHEGSAIEDDDDQLAEAMLSLESELRENVQEDDSESMEDEEEQREYGNAIATEAETTCQNDSEELDCLKSVELRIEELVEAVEALVEKEMVNELVETLEPVLKVVVKGDCSVPTIEDWTQRGDEQVSAEDVDASLLVQAGTEIEELAALSNVLEHMLTTVESIILHEADDNTTPEVITAQNGTSVVDRTESALHTEHTDKNDTFVGDSLEPTMADVPSAGEGTGETITATRVARTSKKASKARKARLSSDEPLDAEAMSKCTCGSKCSIM